MPHEQPKNENETVCDEYAHFEFSPARVREIISQYVLRTFNCVPTHVRIIDGAAIAEYDSTEPQD